MGALPDELFISVITIAELHAGVLAAAPAYQGGGEEHDACDAGKRPVEPAGRAGDHDEAVEALADRDAGEKPGAGGGSPPGSPEP